MNIIDLVKNKFKSIKNRIKMTVVDTINTVTENVRYQFNMHNRRVMALMHIAMLEKSCAACIARNGAMWEKDSKKGINTKIPFELPPIHPYCRCEIHGVDSDSHPEILSGDEWAKTQSLEELQGHFGKKAGELIHNGDLSVLDAIDAYGLRKLTLKEMMKKIQAA